MSLSQFGYINQHNDIQQSDPFATLYTVRICVDPLNPGGTIMEKAIAEILSRMSLKEKISLCNGADFWHSKALKTYGIPAITMSDGPHGVRYQRNAADMLGVNESLPATCYPTAVTSGATWDPVLLQAEGRAIGEEALFYGVDVVLGPGVNIKRNPLCGRNFEYFSEDPFLAGAMGTAWVQGAQDAGVGTSLKHFAANNQEYKRFNGNSQVDERTLRELYLPPFETVIRQTQPETVMCSYPQINGVHASDNGWLLSDVLRKDWGYEGLVVTDWGALCNRVSAMRAGCDLSMPGGSDYMENWVQRAVEEGSLPECAVDACAARVIQLALRGSKRSKGKPFDRISHHNLAQTVAEGGAVLLKNEDHILPLDPADVVLIGEMARTMRYQGAGSSHINPTQLTTLRDAWPQVPFVPGCDENGATTAESLAEAVAAAKTAKVAVVCAGLPDIYESEGFDRENMAMPEGHIRLIEAVATANPHTVVVLFCGSAVETSWLDRVKGVLYMGLPGQAGGAAAARLLTGETNPCGRLTETWPVRYEDVPNRKTFGQKYTCYTEGLYVGYRYYDKAGVPVQFAFGHGLSYTQFTYSDLKVNHQYICATITNTGNCTGAEVVQLYLAPPQKGLYRPVKELKGFAKVTLSPGESRTVTFSLDDRSFAVWSNGWKIPGGCYGVLVGASSVDIRLKGTLDVLGESVPAPGWQAGSWYETLQGLPTNAEFEALYGGPAQRDLSLEKGQFTMEHTTMEMKGHSLVMRMMFKATENAIAKSFGGKADYSNPAFKMMVMSGADSPLRATVLSSGGTFPANIAEGLLEIANGHPFNGIRKMVTK